MRKLFGRHRVDDTSELQRIMALPRRTWTDADLEKLADQLTAVLKTPQGTMKLRPLQALALHDLYTEEGLVAPLGVGTGKTLISGLAPYVLKAKRPMLVLPACLIDKTEREFEELRKHWRIPRNIRMCSYEMLGVVSGATLLEDWQPDFLFMDEAHKAKNRKAGRTRRLYRYLRDHPDVIVAAASGTFMKHSLRDYAHTVRWALEDPPLPRTDGEIYEWSDALDENVNPLARRDPGALLQLCTPGDLGNDQITAARLGFQRRLLETPGVVATRGIDRVDCSLYINALPYAQAPVMEDHYARLRNDMVTPDGWDLFTAAEKWAVARQMSLGFHQIWSPRPPEEWRVARKLWAQFVRQVLADTEEYDTELQVKNACEAGYLPDHEYRQWVKIEPTFTVNPKDIWHDDSALKVCEKWMAEGPGIVWCDHVFFARELARRTGAEYYRNDGKNDNGDFIENADCTKAIIASRKSNSEGRNLQGRPGWTGYSRNLITACPSGADDLEQVIGRTHRTGQQADEVTVDILLGCREHAESWLKALADARAMRDMMGQEQRILIADIIGFPTELQLNMMPGAAWNAPVRKTSIQDLIRAL